MVDYPTAYKYTKEHEWIHVLGDEGTVGITFYAQDQLGDVVYVELPELGESFAAMDVFGSIESVKTASDLYLPVSGVITAVNDVVIDNPEIVNQSPHEEGWLVRIRISDPAELEDLLSADAYSNYIGSL